MQAILQRLCLPLLLAFTLFSGCNVTFSGNNGNLRSVVITPTGATIVVGGTQQFFANVTFGDGTLVTLRINGVFWATSDPSIATINDSGFAIGVSPGITTITGTFSGVSGSTLLTVTARTVSRLVSGTASKLEVTFPQSGRRFVYAANTLEDTISISRVDERTGKDQLVGDVSVSPARGPVWLALDPAGKFLFVANHISSDISVFALDPASGRLTPVPGSPFAVKGGAWSVSVSPDGQLLLVMHLDSPGVTRFHIASATGSLDP